MTTLKEARAKGELDQFIKERQRDTKGDAKALESHGSFDGSGKVERSSESIVSAQSHDD